jgi:hypothetical protein
MDGMDGCTEYPHGTLEQRRRRELEGSWKGSCGQGCGGWGNKAASEILREEAKTRIYQGEYTKTAITLQYYSTRSRLECIPADREFISGETVCNYSGMTYCSRHITYYSRVLSLG